MNDNRIIELEIKTAYQEDLLQELNKIVSQQQHQIIRLSTDNIVGNVESIDEVPPHY
jgi:SlyX protein